MRILIIEFLLDVVAQLAALLDVLDQPRQAFRVQAVRRVEEMKVGMVEIGDRDGFELEAVLRQRRGGGLLDPRDIVAALLVHLLHRHFGGDRAQGGDEFARQKGVQPFGFERATAEGGGGDRNRLAGRLHADIEVGFHVDAHPIARDQRVAFLAHDLHRQHVHVDRRVIVDEGQHESAAVDHHPLAEEAGAHEGGFLRGPVIEPVDHIDDHHDDDDRDDSQRISVPIKSPDMSSTSPARRSRGRRYWPDDFLFPIALNLRT